MADREIIEREVVHTSPSGGGGMGAGVIVGILVAAVFAVIIGLFAFGAFDGGDVNDDGIVPEEVDVNVDVDESGND